MTTEKRNYELRFDSAPKEGSRTVEGYALLFDSESKDLGGFKEIIAPGSLDGVLSRSDVLCLLDHDRHRGVLARANKGSGSLTLTVDEKGLKYRFDAPNTMLGDELLEGIKRGDISSSSFCFTVEDDEWLRMENGSYKRIIRKFDHLYDVSPVYQEAYEGTSVSLSERSQRKFEELKKEGNEDLNPYYDNLKKSLEIS